MPYLEDYSNGKDFRRSVAVYFSAPREVYQSLAGVHAMRFPGGPFECMWRALAAGDRSGWHIPHRQNFRWEMRCPTQVLRNIIGRSKCGCLAKLRLAVRTFKRSPLNAIGVSNLASLL